jgi:3-dehydroquinate dehydratase/shikimate dehydrogenase
MICVSIGRGRHKHMMAEHRYIVEQGAGLVELRVDFIRSRLNVKRLLTNRPCPCIITCRREEDGGQWTGTEAERQMVLRTAIAEGSDYVDLEYDIADVIPRFGKTKRIISYHNFRETPADLELLHGRMARLDPDIIKLATMTHRPSDNLRMLRLIRDSKIPTIGICMGEIGVPTRILGGRFGAPFTFAAFHHERKMAPGQISYRQMVDLYRYDEINRDTEVFGVIADPVGHSLSPIVHNRAFAELKMNRVYLPFRVPRDDLSAFLEDCREMGVKGLSVTIPHKEAVLQYLTQADGAVRGIGAANTVLFDAQHITGLNTDFRAFMDSLDATMYDTEAEQKMTGKTALILGAGGVAKAVAFGLLRRDAQVVIASRTFNRTKQLADRLKCQAIQWYERSKVEPDIVVNGTPMGMHPNVNETPFEADYLQPSMIVFDTVYNPEQTLLIKQAREKNCRTVTGVDMFVRQAALQFKHFTGEDAPIELMRQEVRRAIGAAKM